MSAKILNAEALRVFIDTVDGLHDALLHEIAWVHPGWVDEKGEMYGDYAVPSMKLLFQSQLKDIPAIKLTIGQIKRFRLDPAFEFELEGEWGEDITLFLSGKANAEQSIIVGRDVEYEVLGSEYRGPNYVLVRETSNGVSS